MSEQQQLALPQHLAYEFVERKGIGHPDTLADGIAELASIRYAQYCLREFGVVPHHNLDKVAVYGGRVVFGTDDGNYDRPVRVFVGGRASTSFAGTPIPVAEILTSAAHEQLKVALPGYERVPIKIHVETTNSSKFPHWFAPRGVQDLPELTRVVSNDTAYLVGCTPRTRAELIALITESWLADQAWTGSDIKVLVARKGQHFDVAACVPALAGQVRTVPEFRDRLSETHDALTDLLSSHLGEATVEVRCDLGQTPVDDPLSAWYFTVSGSAIDYGEDGLVGRGNSRHGLISPGHMAGNEVTFGKNPTYHVGKAGAWLVDHATTALSAAAGAGPGRIGITWRKGADYSDPAALEITCPTMDPAEAESLVRGALAERDWLGDLVDGQRYLPRVTPISQLVAELRNAH
ncbi:hypothetical protein MOQ72_27235 [Saccharopolyspora sp. K220]|uniref:methionine adenosyltransferase n=1 Tax=Saccharopolyspora soli TaxID=2926618 RepID=UPI001F58B99D|nr:methionine adenosyltransferase [Saccharopolyspora soli]MCI2421143.1 hypothetical protein [Saccharopolyspora soli]